MGMIKNKLIYEKEKLIIKINSCFKRIFKQPTVISMDQTISTIKNKRASIARYGDGEFDLIFGRKEGFQKPNKILSKRLKEVLKCNNISEYFLVGLPDCFDSLEQFNPQAQLHWKIRMEKYRIKWVRCLNVHFPYYNSQITRFYFDWADKKYCRKWYNNLRSIWDREHIIVVEGEKTRCGVGNELFNNALSVKRILCPAENAFDKYDEILSNIKRIASKNDLIFMALGPTATILAYDLFKEGYWAFDAGHIDIEYEWMIQNATEKTCIKGKYVNEVEGGDMVCDLDEEKYLSEIVCNVI